MKFEKIFLFSDDYDNFREHISGLNEVIPLMKMVREELLKSLFSMEIAKLERNHTTSSFNITEFTTEYIRTKLHQI